MILRLTLKMQRHIFDLNVIMENKYDRIVDLFYSATD